MGEPCLLHEEELFPDKSDLLMPEMADEDDWPGQKFSQIWCKREDDGSWTIWYLAFGPFERDPEPLEVYRGLRTPEAFYKAFSQCGEDFSCRPDASDLSEYFEYFEKEDPEFARAMRTFEEAD
jgi:hypothetical protein